MGKHVRTLIVLGLIVLASPIGCYYMARFGYHQGWWGRDNLLARSLWLCSGPPSLEQSLYPDSIEVVVSACENALAPTNEQFRTRIVPSGRALVSGSRLLDLNTLEWSNVQLNGLLPEGQIAYWLTDDLIIMTPRSGAGLGYFLASLSQQRRVPIFNTGHPDLFVDGKLTSEAVLIDAMNKAEAIFLFQDSDVEAIVLVRDFWNRHEDNFSITQAQVPGQGPNRLETLMNDNGIVYQRNQRWCSVYDSSERLPSPSGRFTAQFDGIYGGDTNVKIWDYGLDAIPGTFGPCAWLPDESAVVLNYRNPDVPVLVSTNFYQQVGDHPQGYFRLPQPVLKFTLPQESLQAVPTPARSP